MDKSPINAPDFERCRADASGIPQREFWLHKNPKTKASVLRGLEQAKAGKKAKSSPDLEADAHLAEQLED